MSVTIASNQVQQKFGAVFDQVLLNEDVIVERYGVPRVAIISYARYARLLRAEQELLRQRILRCGAIRPNPHLRMLTTRAMSLLRPLTRGCQPDI